MRDSLIQSEPSVITGTVVGIAAAGMTLLVVFGVPLTDEQQKAILGFLVVVAPVVAGLIIRGKVSPVYKARRALEE